MTWELFFKKILRFPVSVILASFFIFIGVLVWFGDDKMKIKDLVKEARKILMGNWEMFQ